MYLVQRMFLAFSIFLLFCEQFSFIPTNAAAAASMLYKDFNEKLSDTSDSVQDKVRDMSLSAVHTALNKNANIFKKNHPNEIESKKSLNDNMPADNRRIRKVFDILKPYYEQVPNTKCKTKQIKDYDDEDDDAKLLSSRNWAKQILFKKHNFNEILMKNEPFPIDANENLVKYSCELCPSNYVPQPNRKCCGNKSLKTKRQIVSELLEKTQHNNNNNSNKPSLGPSSSTVLVPNTFSLYPDIIGKRPVSLDGGSVHNAENTEYQQQHNSNLMAQQQPLSQQRQNQFGSLESILNFYGDHTPTDGGGGDSMVGNDGNGGLVQRQTNTSITSIPQQITTVSGQTTPSPQQQQHQQQPYNVSTPINSSNSGINGANDCSSFENANNATAAVLERIFEELELIRQAKQGNKMPEGMCIHF